MPDQATRVPEVFVKEDGTPYPDMGTAVRILRAKNLSEDEWEPIEVDGGYAVRRIGSDALPNLDSEPYFWVRLANRSDVNQTLDVSVAVNGELLVIQRGKEVPLPHRFIQALRDACYPVYDMESGGKNIIGEVQTYPLEVIRPARKKDFEEYRGSDASKLRN